MLKNVSSRRPDYLYFRFLSDLALSGKFRIHVILREPLKGHLSIVCLVVRHGDLSHEMTLSQSRRAKCDNVMSHYIRIFRQQLICYHLKARIILSANATATTNAAANAAVAFDGYNDILMKLFILRANTNAAEYSFALKAAPIAPRANFGKNSYELYTIANQRTR